MKILLSIKPQYAEKILTGAKRYEFRKAVHKREDIKTVVVYATMPVGKVVGEFTVSDVHSAAPKQLWKKTKAHSGISKEFFEEYFDGRDVGFAIEVGDVTRYKVPLPLKDFLPSGFAPQSFVYLEQ